MPSICTDITELGPTKTSGIVSSSSLSELMHLVYVFSPLGCQVVPLLVPVVVSQLLGQFDEASVVFLKIFFSFTFPVIMSILPISIAKYSGPVFLIASSLWVSSLLYFDLAGISGGLLFVGLCYSCRSFWVDHLSLHDGDVFFQLFQLRTDFCFNRFVNRNNSVEHHCGLDIIPTLERIFLFSHLIQ